MSQEWYDRHWRERETQEFVTWFVDDYGGCPSLRPEMYVGSYLDEEVDEYWLRRGFSLRGWIAAQEKVSIRYGTVIDRVRCIVREFVRRLTNGGVNGVLDGFLHSDATEGEEHLLRYDRDMRLWSVVIPKELREIADGPGWEDAPRCSHEIDLEGAKRVVEDIRAENADAAESYDLKMEVGELKLEVARLNGELDAMREATDGLGGLMDTYESGVRDGLGGLMDVYQTDAALRGMEQIDELERRLAPFAESEESEEQGEGR